MKLFAVSLAVALLCDRSLSGPPWPTSRDQEAAAMTEHSRESLIKAKLKHRKEPALYPACRKTMTVFTMHAKLHKKAKKTTEVLAMIGGEGYDPVKMHSKVMSDTWLYDFHANRWIFLKNQLQARALPNQSFDVRKKDLQNWKPAGATFENGTSIIVFGGSRSKKPSSVTKHLMVLKSNSRRHAHWTEIQTKKCPAKRRGHVGVANATHFIIFGGKSHGEHALSKGQDMCRTDVWALPLKATYGHASESDRQWTQGSSMPGHCFWGSTGELLTAPNGTEYLAVFGGRYLKKGKQEKYHYFKSLWLYDLKGDRWTLIRPKGKKPAARDHHGSTSIGSDLYIFGGRTKNAISHAVLNDLWTFSLVTMRWTKLPKGPSKRFEMGVTTIKWEGHQQVLIVGGGHEPTHQHKDLNDIWLFDPRTQGWKLMQESVCPNLIRIPTETGATKGAGDELALVFRGTGVVIGAFVVSVAGVFGARWMWRLHKDRASSTSRAGSHETEYQHLAC